MIFNQYHNSFDYNMSPQKPNICFIHHNVPRNISNVFNNRMLPLPVKSSPYTYEKEYAILALNCKKVYKAKHIPKVVNTMNYDNTKTKIFRTKSTSLEEVNKNTLLNFNRRKKEPPSEELLEKSESNSKNIHKYNLNNTCHVCEKVCQSPSALKIHMAIHSDGKPFKCFFCDKFISKFASNRNRHMKQVHQWDNRRKSKSLFQTGLEEEK